MLENSTSIDEAISRNLLPVLDTFPCPFDATNGQTGIIRIIFPEFTCLCPKTGYPDFATIGVYYHPGACCLELKSWKLYLNSFRMIGTFHEAVSAFLYTTLLKTLEPKWLLLTGDFFPRGNVDTTVVFETPVKRPTGADVLIASLLPHCRESADRYIDK